MEEISLVMESQTHWALGVFKGSVCLSHADEFSAECGAIACSR